MTAFVLRRALAVGSLAALAVDLVMLAGPHWSLTRGTAPLGDFYDAQGRAFLHGHLAVPPSAAGFEGFDVAAPRTCISALCSRSCGCRSCSSRTGSTAG